MRKIPIELFGAKGAEPRSIIVWNGLELSPCSEIPISFFTKNLRTAKELNLATSYYSSVALAKTQSARQVSKDLNSWYKESERHLNEIVNVAHSTVQLAKERENFVGILHSTENDINSRLKYVTSAFENLKNGRLFVAGGEYSATFNSETYTYTISRNLRTPVQVVGTGPVHVEQDQEGRFVVNFDPSSTFKILAGSGLSLKNYGVVSSLNINNIIIAGSGIEVLKNTDSFVVGLKDGIVSSNNKNLKLNRTENGYLVSLDFAFRDSLTYRYTTGYGIRQTFANNTVSYSVSSEAIVDFVAGANTSLFLTQKNGRAGYVVTFFGPELPSNPKFETEWPLTVREEEISDTHITTLGFDSNYENLIVENLQNINKSFINSDSRVSNLTIKSLRSDTTNLLRCPVLSLFNLASSGKIPSNNLKTISFDAATLASIFGAVPKTFNLPIDLSLLVGPINPGTGINLSKESTTVIDNGAPSGKFYFSFNAYSYFEDFVRQVLSNPMFSISDSTKNKNITILDIDTSTAIIPARVGAEISQLDYNMGWVLTDLKKSSSGGKIAFSVADLDFAAGKLRNGQKNPYQLDFDEQEILDLTTGVLKFSIFLHEVEAVGDFYEHTIVIRDGYKNANSTVKWAKPIKGYDKTKDFMVEKSSTTIRPIIRFIGRLVAEWGYTDKDVALVLSDILYIIDNELVEDYYENLTNPDYIAKNGYKDNLILLTVDSIDADGKITMSFKPQKEILDNSLTTIQDLAKGFRITVSFLIKPLSTGDFGKVIGCTWPNHSFDHTAKCSSLAVRTKQILEGDDQRHFNLTGETTVPRPSEKGSLSI